MVVALSLSLSLLVAQVDPPPAPVAAPPAAPAVSWPRWSVGTGIGLFDGAAGLGSLAGLAGQGGLGGLGGLSVSSIAPTPRLTFERLFGEHLAIALGLFGDYQSFEQLDFERGSVGLMIGPRWIVTNPDAPVAVSAYVAGLVSYGAAGSQLSRSSTLALGGAGGLALERWLIDRLALRIQVQLIRATWSESQASVQMPLQSAALPVSNQVNVSFIPGPSAELRLYF